MTEHKLSPHQQAFEKWKDDESTRAVKYFIAPGVVINLLVILVFAIFEDYGPHMIGEPLRSILLLTMLVGIILLVIGWMKGVRTL